MSQIKDFQDHVEINIALDKMKTLKRKNKLLDMVMNKQKKVRLAITRQKIRKQALKIESLSLFKKHMRQNTILAS